MEITVIETGYCDFMEKFAIHAVHLAVIYEESIEKLIMADVAVRAILHESTDTMLYGEIGYVGKDWHIPSPKDKNCGEQLY